MSVASPDATPKPSAFFGAGSRDALTSGLLGTLWFEVGKAVPEWIAAAWRSDPISIDVAWPGSGVRSEIPKLPAWARILASVNIQVPVSSCLVRDIAVPKVALARADSILRFDLEATTPFRAADVFMGWYELPAGSDGAKAEVRQIVMKRSTIAPLLENLKQQKLTLRAISVLDAAGNRLPVNLLDAGDRSRAWLVRATAWGVKLALVAALLAALSAATLTTIDLRREIESANAITTEATSELQAIRRRVDEVELQAAQLALPRLHKKDVVPVLAIWEELTKVLPETTWLNEFRTEDSAVLIEGQSANASELIAVLARSPIFTNVAFVSPVTRDAQRGFERFQIRLQAVRTKQGAQ